MYARVMSRRPVVTVGAIWGHVAQSPHLDAHREAVTRPNAFLLTDAKEAIAIVAEQIIRPLTRLYAHTWPEIAATVARGQVRQAFLATKRFLKLTDS